MAKNTSLLLGDHYEKFVAQQLKSGKFSSASEVIRSALRLFEFEERKRESLIKALKKGESSGFIESFDRTEFLKDLHRKHVRKGQASAGFTLWPRADTRATGWAN